MSTITASQRYTESSPCPVCQGWEKMPRGKGERCVGFLSSDGDWARCTREEFAGGLPIDERTSPPSYAHKLQGECRCGFIHGTGPDPVRPRKTTTAAAIIGKKQRRNGGKSKPKRKLVAKYPYEDENGKVLFYVKRFEPKDFTQEAANGRPSLDGVRRVLYRLPAIVKANRETDPVFIPEGEEDVKKLVALGLVATCNPGGAGKWKPDYSESLRGFECVILCDNDDAGHKHQLLVARSLYGIARSVKVLRLPGVKDKGDVSDWLADGHDVDELWSLVWEAEPWTPGTPVGEVISHRQLMQRVFPPLEWIVEDLIQKGALTLFSGRKKLGKSRLMFQCAYAVGSGSQFLGKRTRQGSVVMLSLEDGQRRLQARALEMGMPEDLPVTYLGKYTPLNEGGLEELRELIDARKPTLVIVDTFTAAITGKKFKESESGDSGDMFNALRRMAQETDCAIVVIGHHGKTPHGDPGFDWRGSSAAPGASECNLSLYKRESAYVLASEGKDIETTELRLRFNAGDTWQWDLVGDERDVARNEAETAIFDALRILGAGDATTISAELSKDRGGVQKHLKRMREEERIGHKVETKGGQRRVVYSLL